MTSKAWRTQPAKTLSDIYGMNSACCGFRQSKFARQTAPVRDGAKRRKPMAKRAMMYCPRCRNVGLTTVELVTENPEQDVFRCPNSHAFPNYMELMKMNPDMIKLVASEKPQPGDVKVEVWVDKQILDRFQSLYPTKLNAT